MTVDIDNPLGRCNYCGAFNVNCECVEVPVEELEVEDMTAEDIAALTMEQYAILRPKLLEWATRPTVE